MFSGFPQAEINDPYRGSGHPLCGHHSVVSTGEHWRTHQGQLCDKEVEERYTPKPTQDYSITQFVPTGFWFSVGLGEWEHLLYRYDNKKYCSGSVLPQPLHKVSYCVNQIQTNVNFLLRSWKKFKVFTPFCSAVVFQDGINVCSASEGLGSPRDRYLLP